MRCSSFCVLFGLLFATSSLAQPTLLILGDSLSAGYGFSSEQSWVALLAQRLQQHKPPWQVVNASRSGDTTIQSLNRLPRLLQQHQPALVLIALAANDGLRALPLTTIYDNLRQLIHLSQHANAQVLLVGVRLPPNYGPHYTEAFSHLFTRLAEEFKLPPAPLLLDQVDTDWSLMQADGLHPTAAAQPVLLDNVWPSLKQLINNRD